MIKIAFVVLCLCLVPAAAMKKKAKGGKIPLCLPSCPDACAALAAVCIDIPGVYNCKKEVEDCGTSCGLIDDCRKKCPKHCKAGDCTVGTDAQKNLCLREARACEFLCRAQCPVDTFTDRTVGQIQGIVKFIQKLLAGYLGPLAPNLAALAGPGPSSGQVNSGQSSGQVVP